MTFLFVIRMTVDLKNMRCIFFKHIIFALIGDEKQNSQLFLLNWK